MKRKQIIDTMVVGFALFAMFLGAGNLIFPPTLGAIAGDQWFKAMIGFMMTGIGLPILGVVASAKAGGRLEDVAGKVNNTFSILFGSLIMICIGPLLAIPRTCATTYEIAVQPLFGNVSPILVSIIFFGLTLFFTLNQSKVVDKIGSILTPILLVILFTIIISSIVKPIGVPKNTGSTQNFVKGFKEGYQTMDAIGSIIMATIVINSVKKRGYTSQKDMFKMTVISGVIAAFCLAFVYGGLVYIGGTGSGYLTIDPENPNRVANLIFMVNKIMGQYGTAALALTVALACLTTSIGLTATAGEFFSDLTHGKLTYKSIVIFTCLFSGIIATNGVDSIITFSGPILSVLYPVAIVIILLNIFDNKIKYKAIYKGATLGAFMASLLDTIANIGDFKNIRSFLDRIPLGSEGFAWVIPAIVFGFAFIVLEMAIDNNNQKGVI